MLAGHPVPGEPQQRRQTARPLLGEPQQQPGSEVTTEDAVLHAPPRRAA
jgi:hypothetical protein